MHFIGDHGNQNFLVFATMLSSLILDSNKKVTKWILTGISSHKITSFGTNLEPTMSNFANGRVILKFNTYILVQKSSSLYDIPKNCLFVTFKLVRTAIKSQFTCKGPGKAFDGEDLWSFDNDFARNVIFCGVGNSSSSHTVNWKNNFLVSSEGPTFGISDSTDAAEKIFSTNFSKANTKCFLKFTLQWWW